MLHSASNKIATLRLGSLVWPGPCEKALLASGSVWPLERSRICSPLGGSQGRDGEVGEQRAAVLLGQCPSSSSEVAKEMADSTDGRLYQACSCSPKSQIKDPPPLSLSLSLSLSSCLHQSVVSLSVSHLSNPVTLLQAPPPSHLRFYIFLAPSRPPLYNSAQCWITELRGCCSEGLWQASTRMVR